MCLVQKIKMSNKYQIFKQLNKVYYSCKITIHVKSHFKKWDKLIFFHVTMKILMMYLVIDLKNKHLINLKVKEEKMMMMKKKVKENQLKESRKVNKKATIIIIIQLIIIKI